MFFKNMIEQLARTHVEQEKISERYRMVMVGGRIKAAGVSFSHLYDAASPLIADPTSVEAAFETSKRFARLKENPPLPFRVAFFPQDEVAMRTAFRGSGIYRPTIKTDQGSGGNVGYFTIDEAGLSQIKGRITKEEGVAVIEAFLQQRFLEATVPLREEDILPEIENVKKHYQTGDYRRAYESITKIRGIGAVHGIETTRRAGVGRQEFFFFRPVQINEPLVVGEDLINVISEKTQEIVSRVERLAIITKGLVGVGMPLADAVRFAHEFSENEVYTNADTRGMLYFQPDVLLRSDGTFDIERVNMPDLGMFLTHPYISTPFQNETFGKIRELNEEIKEEVVGVIAASVGKNVILLTRDEVQLNSEDILEQLELSAIGEGLRQRGKEVSMEILSNVNTIPSGSSMLLFNVLLESPGYEDLLYRVARGELHCYPDPFAKLFEKEGTTFERKNVSGPVLDKFLKIIAPSALDKPEGVQAKYMTIQKALRIGGIDSDIVYFSANGNGTYVPTFRYDVKSFLEVYKAVENMRRQGKDVSTITAIPIPFQPKDAIVEGSDGPRIAVFRFMFVRK